MVDTYSIDIYRYQDDYPLFIQEADGLKKYINFVNRLPILSHEQEIDLARRFHEHNDLEAARKLVMSHLRLVVSIARGYLGYGIPYSDLIQEGNVGLMKAVKNFDPNRGVRLVSFAIHWIKAEIHNYILRNWRIVKVATTKAKQKLFFNLRSLKKNNRTLTSSEVDSIAKALDVRKEEVREMEVAFYSQDIPLEHSSDDDVAPIDYLASLDYDPAVLLEKKEKLRLETNILPLAIKQLDDRSRCIIQERWLREDGGATLQELATKYGISAERVRQIESRALKKLKEIIKSSNFE